MARIGLVVRPGIREAVSLGLKLVEWALSKGHEMLYEKHTAKLLHRNEPGCPSEQIVGMANPIVTLGGDGTLIGVARYVSGDSPVLLGVNFGNLGFLTEISPDQLFETLEVVLSGRAELGERGMISAEVLRKGQTVFSSQAVNDAVIQKGSRNKLVDIDLAVNGEDVMRIRADGLIVATPTGSTAYALAAGGSIVHPSLGVVLITPICAHSLTLRPLILPMESVLTARVPAYDGRVYIVIDGQVSFQIQTGDTVKITKANNKVTFVESPTKSYFEILRTKLNWGIANSPG